MFWEFLHVASTLLVSGVIYYRIFFWTFTSSTSCSALQCFGLWRLLSSQRHRLASVVVLLVIVSSWWCFLTTTSASPVSRSTASYRSTALCGQRLFESNEPSDWLVHFSFLKVKRNSTSNQETGGGQSAVPTPYLPSTWTSPSPSSDCR